MSGSKTVHQCLFCPQTFGSAPEKDDHILEHFAQETCADCDQSLIRIGRNLYTQHNAVTCIKKEFKLEVGTFHGSHNESINQNYEEVDTATVMPSSKDIVYNQEMEIKIEPERSDTCVDIMNLPETSDMGFDSSQMFQHKLSVKFTEESSRKNSSTNRASCDICGESFHISSLKRHKKLKHSTVETNLGRIRCKICQTTFLQPEYLRKHMRMKHDNHLPQCEPLRKPIEMNVMNCSQVEENPTNDDKTYTPSIFSTDEIVNSKLHTEQLQNHETVDVKIFTPVNITASNTNFSNHQVEIKMEPGEQIEQFLSVDLGNFIETRDEDFESNQVYQGPSHSTIAPEKLCKEKSYKHKCDICGKKFQIRYNLKQHKKYKHSDPGTIFDQFECGICKTVLHRKDSLRRHMQLKHDPNCIKFNCEFCRAIFMSNDSLQNHLSRCRRAGLASNNSDIWSIPYKTGEHRCIDCKKTFVSAENLKNHRPICGKLSTITFECFLCQNIFKSRWNLRSHIQTIHLPINKIKCELCDQSFVRKNVYENHKKIVHLDIRNFMCSTCGKAFKTGRSLKNHEYIHTGEKPLKCTYEGCDKSFRNYISKALHLKSHQGLKRYQCKIDGCNEQFGGRTGYRKHKFNVHGIPFTKTKR